MLDSFNNVFKEIIIDRENREIATGKCSTQNPIIQNREYSHSLTGINKKVKMFKCPFKNQDDGTGQGQYYVCQGIDSESVFLFLNVNNAMNLIGFVHD